MMEELRVQISWDDSYDVFPPGFMMCAKCSREVQDVYIRDDGKVQGRMPGILVCGRFSTAVGCMQVLRCL